MCGRYVFTSPLEAIQQMFKFNERLNVRPSYNVAPTHDMPIVRRKKEAEGRELVNARWGLIPVWAKDEKIGYRTINARADTVAIKPAFRDAYKKRRCLVVANGFFEWRKEGEEKQPYLIRLTGGEPFAFAGLWSWWKSADGDEVTSYTIITTEPNELCAELHNRMPVILAPEHHEQWLDTEADGAELLKPFAANEMEAFPVSKRVGNVGNNFPALLDRILDAKRVTLT